MWVSAGVDAAVEAALVVFESVSGLNMQTAHLDLESCTPAEADRRVGIRRAVGLARGPRRFSRHSCIKCGQPLTDQESIRLQMGPHCRVLYGVEYVRALNAPRSDARMWLGTKVPKQWLREVLRDFDAHPR